jgi:hypothetical protein
MSTSDYVRSTRLTPDDIQPAVGELYRGRTSGHIIKIIGYEAHRVFYTWDRSNHWMHEADFWREFIHAKARQD